MSLLDLIKDKFTDAELKARIQKELRQSTLDAVQEFKTDPGVQANLLKGAIDKMYPYKENIDILACEIISNKYFQKLLEEKITEIILSLVNNIQSSSIQQICKNEVHKENEEMYAETEDAEDDTFVDLNAVKYFDKHLACEEAKQKGIIKNKNDESEFFIEMMNIEDSLIQEEKLCPHCYALGMIKKGKCIVCGKKIK